MKHELEPHCIDDEYIIAAAVYYDDSIFHEFKTPNNKQTGFVISGFRHAMAMDILQMILPADKFEDFDDLSARGYTRGFLTSHNRYVDRFEGFLIARSYGQIIETSPIYNLLDELVSNGKYYLVSEDLW